MREELEPHIYEKVVELSSRGDSYCSDGEFGEAIRFYLQAIELLPEPIEQWEASTWLFAALADAYFLGRDFNSARETLLRAMHFPDAIGNPFLHLRLGESQFELGNEVLAADELTRAYMGGGMDIFSEEDPKYFLFLKAKLREPPGGW